VSVQTDDRPAPARLGQARWPAAVVLLVLVVVLVTYLVSGKGNGLPLDPDGTGPDGARAVARVLDRHGVPVLVVRTDAELAQATSARSSATVVVSQTDRLGAGDVDQLAALAPGGGALVLVTPSQDQLDRLAPSVHATGLAPNRVKDPGCSVPAARAAGRADAGGVTYAVEPDAAAQSCYRVGGGASYVVVDGSRPVVVMGQPRVLTNSRLAHEGNAALALGTLGGSDGLIWFVPSGEGGTERSSLRSLLPHWVGWVVLQLFAVVLVCMLWRGRRLGRLVREPLPVVVRAVETTEGRARMYRRSRAAGRAAATLRAATAERLRRRTGLPRGTSPVDLVRVVAARTGRPEQDVGALLFGPPPADDAGLVRLAQVLDQLDREVRRP
jgi:Domain of unknown function (DUF4350)